MRSLFRALLVISGALLVSLFLVPVSVQAATCPNANPVVNENQCMGAGSSAYQMNNFSEDIAGYTPQTSYNLGQDVPLKIARNQPTFPTSLVDVTVFRTGEYGGKGGRIVNAKTGVAVNNDFTCNPMDSVTGELSCANWSTTYTIPASALTTSGVYVALLTAEDTGIQNQVVFVVRDDSSQSKALLVLPTSTYQAYNNWGGKSLYFDKNGGANTIAGTGRAVKVSFDRPTDRADAGRNRYFGPDSVLVSWMEKEGYDVTYTTDDAVDANPASLRQHKVVIVSGHSEYWSAGEMAAFKAARDAGVSIAGFSGNTSYWKVRYEDDHRTLVCYKTVEGSGASGSGKVTPNDPGPDGIAGTADDALGADGIAGTADDNPQNATTTWRDNGAPPGDPNAPPGGRVGPDQPENSLWGNMYVGDHDSITWGIQVPPDPGNGTLAGSRDWRNSGISTNTTTTIGTNVVGWEWDQIPTQAQYLAQEPAGVKPLTQTTIDATDASWLQDEGRARATTPPPGQPNTVSAVTYTAPSGAHVFSAGTNQWAYGLSDPRLAQATYNIFSDMGMQPVTPVGVTLDAQGSDQAPTASFSVSASPVPLNKPVTFDASASADPDGTIAKYEWDLDGDGTYETSSGTNPVLTHTFTSEGTWDVHLRVTDNGGVTDTTTRTITVIGNQPPVASLTAAPNPAVTGQDVTLDASGSKDPDGSVTDYQWDLDGNGTYETDTGSSATTKTSFANTGTQIVGVKVTDNGGKSATATLPITVNSGGLSEYGDAVLNTPGLTHYWRMGESVGPTLADSVGTANATVTGGTFGVPGGPPQDPNTAVRFNGTSDFSKVDLDLSHPSAITVEFWLKWNQYVNDDHLAMEFTPNFNNQAGGFLVDPDAPQFNGTFGVALGVGTSRNTVFFQRPSAGVWHHYAFVLDPTAPAASEITPYVDGQAVTYQKNASGTGAGNFANSSLYLMSRGGTTLFGAGDLDELAIYNGSVDSTTIAEHAASYGTNRRPNAAFSMSPSPARIGQTVTFDASGSNDPDGNITKYDWDLDGNGTFETSTGTNPVVAHSYSSEQSVAVHLRVTDDQFGSDTQTHTLFVGNSPPVPKVVATPNPAMVGQKVTIDASASSDPDGSIAKYEWDLDGDGTYETDTGTTPTTNHTFSATGTYTIGLRVTDNEGKTATTTLPITVNANGVSNYGDTVLSTLGLAHYWRMGEATGPTLADSVGTAQATVTGGTFGVPGGPSGDPNTAVRFNGTSDAGSAPVDLSGTAQLTVEFWLKWNQYANDNRLAMEFTPNFNNQPGGFLVDPDAPQFNGTFGVGLGVGNGRNTVYFPRPTAGVWHHYAFVMDTTAPGATQITPYVDGKAVSYQKDSSGTSGGKFANSSLYLMSRGGTSLFGAGDLDEVALYTSALDAGTIADHYAADGTNRRPVSSFTASPSTAAPGKQITFDGSASHDPDGRIVDYQWDLDGDGSFETDSGTNPVVTKTYSTEQTTKVRLRVLDDQNGTDASSQTVTIVNQPPAAALSYTPQAPVVGQTVNFDASASTDPDGTIAKYEWDLDGDGTYETVTGSSPKASKTYSTAGQVNVGLRITDDSGKTATLTQPITIRKDTYRNLVMASPSLLHYWRLGESTGTSFADAAGTSNATEANATLGVTGALFGDSDLAARFNGTNAYAKAPVDLSSAQTITVEFWLKWNAFASDDHLAMEFTPNFNNAPGGFLVDPNSGTSFAVSIGTGTARNTVTFTRPSAGVWHHYAFVLDQTAAAANEIVPYVDGKPVTFKKPSSGTTTGSFANSTLYFMSRGGTTLFGAGDLDELAIYRGALGAQAIADHYAAGTP